MFKSLPATRLRCLGESSAVGGFPSVGNWRTRKGLTQLLNQSELQRAKLGKYLAVCAKPCRECGIHLLRRPNWFGQSSPFKGEVGEPQQDV